MQIEVSRKDLTRLLNKLPPMKADLAIRRSFRESASYIAGWIKDKRLTGPRPRFLGVVTGRLRSSITPAPIVKTGNTYVARIGTNVTYARKHELGTYGMPVRPFLRPALEDKSNIRKVINDLVRNINKLLRA